MNSNYASSVIMIFQCHALCVIFYHLLFHALLLMAQQEYPLNPKAMSLGELYGENDLSTNEWTDGVLSSLMRSACAGVDTKTHVAVNTTYSINEHTVGTYIISQSIHSCTSLIFKKEIQIDFKVVRLNCEKCSVKNSIFGILIWNKALETNYAQTTACNQIL